MVLNQLRVSREHIAASHVKPEDMPQPGDVEGDDLAWPTDSDGRPLPVPVWLASWDEPKPAWLLRGFLGGSFWCWTIVPRIGVSETWHEPCSRAPIATADAEGNVEPASTISFRACFRTEAEARAVCLRRARNRLARWEEDRSADIGRAERDKQELVEMIVRLTKEADR